MDYVIRHRRGHIKLTLNPWLGHEKDITTELYQSLLSDSRVQGILHIEDLYLD